MDVRQFLHVLEVGKLAPVSAAGIEGMHHSQGDFLVYNGIVGFIKILDGPTVFRS